MNTDNPSQSVLLAGASALTKPSDVFQINPGFETIAHSIKLRAIEWRVLFAIDGYRSVREICGQLHLDEPQARDIFGKLMLLGLVREEEISLTDFLQRAPRGGAGHLPTGLAVDAPTARAQLSGPAASILVLGAKPATEAPAPADEPAPSARPEALMEAKPPTAAAAEADVNAASSVSLAAEVETEAAKTEPEAKTEATSSERASFASETSSAGDFLSEPLVGEAKAVTAETGPDPVVVARATPVAPPTPEPTGERVVAERGPFLESPAEPASTAVALGTKVSEPSAESAVVSEKIASPPVETFPPAAVRADSRSEGVDPVAPSSSSIPPETEAPQPAANPPFAHDEKIAESEAETAAIPDIPSTLLEELKPGLELVATTAPETLVAAETRVEPKPVEGPEPAGVAAEPTVVAPGHAGVAHEPVVLPDEPVVMAEHEVSRAQVAPAPPDAARTAAEHSALPEVAHRAPQPIAPAEILEPSPVPDSSTPPESIAATTPEQVIRSEAFVEAALVPSLAGPSQFAPVVPAAAQATSTPPVSPAVPVAAALVPEQLTRTYYRPAPVTAAPPPPQAPPAAPAIIPPPAPPVSFAPPVRVALAQTPPPLPPLTPARTPIPSMPPPAGEMPPRFSILPSTPVAPASPVAHSTGGMPAPPPSPSGAAAPLRISPAPIPAAPILKSAEPGSTTPFRSIFADAAVTPAAPVLPTTLAPASPPPARVLPIPTAPVPPIPIIERQPSVPLTDPTSWRLPALTPSTASPVPVNPARTTSPITPPSGVPTGVPSASALPMFSGGSGTLVPRTGRVTPVLPVMPVVPVATPPPVPKPVPVSAPGPVPALEATTPPPLPSAAPARHFRLGAVLDFIMKQSGGGTLGQLATYRILLQLPPELLREAGIRSLEFDGTTDAEIKNVELQRALTTAVGKVLEVEVPPDAFLR